MEKKTQHCEESGILTSEKTDICCLGMGTKKEKKRILLHSCCGPCSTACIERLLPDYKITVFFYNPNITEAEEYEKRKSAQIAFLTAYNEKLSEEDKVELESICRKISLRSVPATVMSQKVDFDVPNVSSCGWIGPRRQR